MVACLAQSPTPATPQLVWYPPAEITHPPSKAMVPPPWTVEKHARASRMMLNKFFGVGPHTTAGGESRFWRAHTQVSLRIGRPWKASALTVPPLNVGLRLFSSYDFIFAGGTQQFPAAKKRHPRAPGLKGATWLFAASLEGRWDNRRGGPLTRHGTWVEWAAGAGTPWGQAPLFWLTHVDIRHLWAQTPRFSTALRLWGRYVSSQEVPIFFQSSLGGGSLLRGHVDGRFVDQGAWSLEAEQRLRLGHSHWGKTTIGWHLDPFMAVGQVFGSHTGPVSKPRPTAGVGLRALVSPSTLVRLDMATDTSQILGHLALGYPF